MQRWYPVCTFLLCLTLISVVFFSPLAALAQVEEGIVPACPQGDPNCTNAYDPDNYGSCEVVLLLNNILQFLIGLVAVIAAVAFVYAGFQLVVSQGNPSKIQAAKSLFSNVLIGFLIILSAYLIVETIMKVLVGDTSSLLQWNTVDCSYANKAGEADYKIPKLSQNDANLYEFEGGDGDVIVVGSAGGDTFGNFSTNNPGIASAAGACEPGLVSSVWGSRAGAAQCIIRNESACGASPISRSDIGADGNPFSFGAMQINTTVHPVKGCGTEGIPDLNCPAAWSGRNYSAQVINPGLYKACRDALLNNRCNMINGARIYSEARNSWRPWSTAAGCRLI